MRSLYGFFWSVQFAAIRKLVLNSDVVFQLEKENPVFRGEEEGLDYDHAAKMI